MIRIKKFLGRNYWLLLSDFDINMYYTNKNTSRTKLILGTFWC